jgi:hypothetical protein
MRILELHDLKITQKLFSYILRIGDLKSLKSGNESKESIVMMTMKGEMDSKILITFPCIVIIVICVILKHLNFYYRRMGILWPSCQKRKSEIEEVLLRDVCDAIKLKLHFKQTIKLRFMTQFCSNNLNLGINERKPLKWHSRVRDRVKNTTKERNM